jgi:hypothetical protein
MRKLIAVFLTLIFLFSGCKSQPVRLPESAKLTEEADTGQLVDVQEETETDQSDEAVSAHIPQDETPTETEISKTTDSPSPSQPSSKPASVETDPPVTEKQTKTKPPEEKRSDETEPAVTVPEKEQETVPRWRLPKRQKCLFRKLSRLRKQNPNRNQSRNQTKFLISTPGSVLPKVMLKVLAWY